MVFEQLPEQTVSLYYQENRIAVSYTERPARQEVGSLVFAMPWVSGEHMEQWPDSAFVRVTDRTLTLYPGKGFSFPEGKSSYEAVSKTDEETIFTGISLLVGEGSSQRPVTFDLIIDKFDRALVTWRLAWIGEGEIAGRRWRFIVADWRSLGQLDNFDFFIIEPADVPTRLQAEDALVPNFFHDNVFTPGSQAILDGVLYKFRFNAQGPTCEMICTGTRWETHDVAITGDWAVYLTFRGNSMLPVTGRSVKVPITAGELTGCLLFNQGWYGYSSTSPNRVKLTGAPTTLEAGGPLRSTVSVERLKTTLDVQYSLRGVGGESYFGASRKTRGADKSIKVYQDGGLVKAGKVEYG